MPDNPLANRGTVAEIFSEITANQEIFEHVAKERLHQIQNAMKTRYDRQTRPVDLVPGDIVYVHMPRLSHRGTKLKLQPMYHGPFTIIRFTSPSTVKLKRLSDGKVIQKAVSVMRLKKGTLRCNPSSWGPTPSADPPGDGLTPDDLKVNDNDSGQNTEEYGTPNTKIFKTHKLYSRSKIYIQHLQNVFTFFFKHIQDIYLLFKIFKYIQELRSWM